MSQKFKSTSSISINAPVERVWEAITDPDHIKKYMFGVDVKSDWQVGGNITYTGVWKDKPFEDKGKILELAPHKVLKTSYWTAFTGRQDKPENYDVITYELVEDGGQTMLTISTENNFSQEEADQTAKNWAEVEESIKKLLEE